MVLTLQNFKSNNLTNPINTDHVDTLKQKTKKPSNSKYILEVKYPHRASLLT